METRQQGRRRRSKRLRIIPQPPVDRSRRRSEARSFWVAFNVLLAGLLLLFAGAMRQVGVADPEDERNILVYYEWAIIDAFARGGGPGEIQNGDDFCRT